MTDLITDQPDELDHWRHMVNAAIDWQYLIVLSGGMARKSDCEAWLSRRFGIDEYTGRQITNSITSGPVAFTCSSRDGVTWNEMVIGRPAPIAGDYLDIDYDAGKL